MQTTIAQIQLRSMCCCIIDLWSHGTCPFLKQQFRKNVFAISRACAHEHKEMKIYANKNKNKAFQMNFLNANHHNIIYQILRFISWRKRCGRREEKMKHEQIYFEPHMFVDPKMNHLKSFNIHLETFGTLTKVEDWSWQTIAARFSHTTFFSYSTVDFLSKWTTNVSFLLHSCSHFVCLAHWSLWICVN